MKQEIYYRIGEIIGKMFVAGVLLLGIGIVLGIFKAAYCLIRYIIVM